MTLEAAAIAAADWRRAEDESADIDTGIEALGRLIAALSDQDAAFRVIITAAAHLIIKYCEAGEDETGEATQSLMHMLRSANL